MIENLVIVESPAKAKTIEKYLGKDYTVVSSYGHIRDLKKNDLDVEGRIVPVYEVPNEKKEVVKALQDKAKKAKTIWLASDEDREGEAISWHLCEVLNLDPATTKRIVFHEITKDAILKAIEKPRLLDMNLVYAQQARRVLDRIVGFKLSPVLWRKVKPQLSAGRVQSVAVKLIVEREREIQEFKSVEYYKVTAVFLDPNAGSDETFRAEIEDRFETEEEAVKFINRCVGAQYDIKKVVKRPLSRMPHPPFTTSTLQQEAARQLGYSVSQTMMIAQHLYENGHITYMRTDSVNLSELAIKACNDVILKEYGKEYAKSRHYTNKARGAQEAHEAIRPTDFNKLTISGNAQERNLYALIWRRAVASQMTDAKLEKTVATIGISGNETNFLATGEVVAFDGFMKIYNPGDDEEFVLDGSQTLPPLKAGQILTYKEVNATQHFTLAPLRFTEASLVKKMEDLGIGRPSTYAPTISTIQQRDYVRRGESQGETRRFKLIQLADGEIKTFNKSEHVGKEKGKLLPTDIGTIVDTFLNENFPAIMDYNFTASVEEKFDKIASGKLVWDKMLVNFQKSFDPVVNKVLDARGPHKAGERWIGNDPDSGENVYVKVGRFGPVVQLGDPDEIKKPKFSQLPQGISMNEVTLELALQLLKLPRVLGDFKRLPVTVGIGKFGPYLLYEGKYSSLPDTDSPYTIKLERAKQLIIDRYHAEEDKHVKRFEEDDNLEIMTGRYGAYITYNGKNSRIPRQLQSKAKDLSYEDCMKLISRPGLKNKLI